MSKSCQRPPSPSLTLALGSGTTFSHSDILYSTIIWELCVSSDHKLKGLSGCSATHLLTGATMACCCSFKQFSATDLLVIFQLSQREAKGTLSFCSHWRSSFCWLSFEKSDSFFSHRLSLWENQGSLFPSIIQRFLALLRYFQWWHRISDKSVLSLMQCFFRLQVYILSSMVFYGWSGLNIHERAWRSGLN